MKLFIHIGAHKTGTTHFQQTLHTMQRNLNDSGYYVYLPDKFRKNLKTLYPNGKRRIINKILPVACISRSKLKLFLPPDTNWKKCIISDENILGVPIDLMSSYIYRDAEERLKYLRALNRQTELTIFLSIRSFDRVLPGAYSTDLKYLPHNAVKAKTQILEDINNGRLPSWVDFIERMLKMMPNLKLKIWTQELYKRKSSEIIEHLFCLENVEIPIIPSPKETETPSFEVIKLVEKTLKECNYTESEWKKECQHIFEQHQSSDSNEKFNFLLPEQITSLRKAYESDIKKIADRWPSFFVDNQI